MGADAVLICVLRNEFVVRTSFVEQDHVVPVLDITHDSHVSDAIDVPSHELPAIPAPAASSSISGWMFAVCALITMAVCVSVGVFCCWYSKRRIAPSNEGLIGQNRVGQDPVGHEGCPDRDVVDVHDMIVKEKFGKAVIESIKTTDVDTIKKQMYVVSAMTAPCEL